MGWTYLVLVSITFGFPLSVKRGSPPIGNVESGVKSAILIPEDTHIDAGQSYQLRCFLSEVIYMFCYSPRCEVSQESICDSNDVKYICIFIKTRTG